MIQDYNSEASSQKIKSWYQLPHEKLFDQFGIFIAESIFPPKKVRDELKSILKNKLSRDLARIENMLKLPPFEKFDGLREQLIEFSAPYKNELILLWKRDKSKKINPPYLFRFVQNFEDMFK